MVDNDRRSSRMEKIKIMPTPLDFYTRPADENNLTETLRDYHSSDAQSFEELYESKNDSDDQSFERLRQQMEITPKSNRCDDLRNGTPKSSSGKDLSNGILTKRSKSSSP